ncbi:MAG: hypothetical protein QE271_13470 [Bacteriovoracaceae bacterium]|nr:hypothetical protein [Bacteriovoracaceae bacterium]
MLKNNLVIAFSDASEIYQQLNVITNLKQRYPNEDFSLVTWDHHREILQSYSGKLESIHLINKGLISKSYHNHLINLAFAQNLLWDAISPLMTKKFHKIITLSNNQESYLFTSLMSSENYTGSKFSPYRTIIHSNLAAHFVNEIYTANPWIMNKNELYQQMFSLSKLEKNSQQFLQNNSDLTDYIGQKLQFLRSKFKFQNKEKKLLAIDLFQLRPENNLAEVYYHLYQSNNILPILLVQSKNASQLKLANEINEVMDGKCISLEFSTNNFPKCFVHFDAALNFGGASKVLGNFFRIPQISIIETIPSLGHSGTSDNVGDFILQASHNEVDYQLLLDLINIQLTGPLEKNLQISENNRLYAIIKDDFGPMSFCMNRNFQDIEAETQNFSNLCMRSFYYEHFLGHPRSIEMFELLETSLLKKNLEIEYQEIEIVYKSTLKSIRQLHELKYNSETQGQIFFKELDELFNPKKINHLANLVCITTRHELDKVIHQQKDSVEELEKILLELKNNLLAGSNFIKFIFDKLVKSYSGEMIASKIQERP